VTGPATAARPWLIAVSDRHRLCAAACRPIAEAEELLVVQALAAVAGGVAAFQVREPDLEGRALLALVVRLAATGVRLLVNDRADVAAAAGVGLHLRASSMPTDRVRAWLGPRPWITRSVHDLAELRAAGPVDAVVAGTVRPSRSKPDGHPVIGFDGLAALVAASPVPVVDIGGLSGRDWPALQRCGAAGLAAIGAFLPRADESVAGAVQRAVAELSDSVRS
jgi:thiamine-phosphate pyrophosphorylase